MQAIIPDCSTLISIRDSDMLFCRNLDVLIYPTPIPVITNSYAFLCGYLLNETSLSENQFSFSVRLFILRLTLRRLMSYIYMEHPFLMFLDHTQRRNTVVRTPLDE